MRVYLGEMFGGLIMFQKHLEYESLVHYRRVAWVVPSIIDASSHRGHMASCKLTAKVLITLFKDTGRLLIAYCVVTLKCSQLSEENKAIRVYSILYIFMYVFR